MTSASVPTLVETEDGPQLHFGGCDDRGEVARSEEGEWTGRAWALAGFMVVTGLTHATAPGYYRRLVPAWMPAAGGVVAVSGVCDVAAGVLVAVPATRRAGGWATAGLITAYLPAHLDPLRRAGRATRRFDRPAGVAARVAVNLGYVAWAVLVARRAGDR